MNRPPHCLSMHRPRPLSALWGSRPRATVAALSLLVGLAGMPGWASAAGPTWIWLDDAGRRVYSDQPPPPSLPPKRLLQAGSPRAPLPEVPADAAGVGTPPANGAAVPAVSPPGTAPRPTPTPPATETPAQAAQRRAIEARNAEIRAENCQRAQAAMTTLRSNARLLMTNAEGRQVPMDAASRQTEMARLQQIIGANCN